jgi:hypothetical protein
VVPTALAIREPGRDDGMGELPGGAVEISTK